MLSYTCHTLFEKMQKLVTPFLDWPSHALSCPTGQDIASVSDSHLDQPWLLTLFAKDVVEALLLFKVQSEAEEHPRDVWQEVQNVGARHIIRQEQLGQRVALLTGQTLLDEDEVHHGVVRVECDRVQLVRKSGSLQVQLSAYVVE
jgi:hypothetical protein